MRLYIYILISIDIYHRVCINKSVEWTSLHPRMSILSQWSQFFCYERLNKSVLNLRSPLDSIRDAMLTVSPNKQYRGIFNPTTPANKVNPYLDSKVHGATMGPIWGWQDPSGPHIGPVNFAIWVPFWFWIILLVSQMALLDTCINLNTSMDK